MLTSYLSANYSSISLEKLTTLKPACPKDFINDLPSHSATLFAEILCCYNQDNKRTFTADFLRCKTQARADSN
jgi:hypothetical protein